MLHGILLFYAVAGTLCVPVGALIGVRVVRSDDGLLLGLMLGPLGLIVIARIAAKNGAPAEGRIEKEQPMS